MSQEPRGGLEGGRDDLRLARLRRLRNALAGEIAMASDRGELTSPSSQAVMMARDSLNHALAVAGDPDARGCREDSERWEMVKDAYRRFVTS
jgi:hypothetical protein